MSRKLAIPSWSWQLVTSAGKHRTRYNTYSRQTAAKYRMHSYNLIHTKELNDDMQHIIISKLSQLIPEIRYNKQTSYSALRSRQPTVFWWATYVHSSSTGIGCRSREGFCGVCSREQSGKVSARLSLMLSASSASLPGTDKNSTIDHPSSLPHSRCCWIRK